MYCSDCETKASFDRMGDIVFACFSHNKNDAINCSDAWKKGNKRGAAEILLKWFRTRKVPKWYFDITKRMTIVRNLLNYFPEDIKKSKEVADKLLEGEIYWGGTYQNCGFPPKWMEFKADEEYNEFLNRHFFLFDLGIAYWCTSDEKYARAYVRLLTDFVDGVAPVDIIMYRTNGTAWNPGPWNLLNVGIRAKTWLYSLPFFIDSPSMNGELLIRMFYSLIQSRTVLRYLSPEIWPNYDHNHFVMEMQGLFTIGVMLPELSATAGPDAQFAMLQLERAIECQILDDGVQCEETPNYHFGCINWFIEPMLLGELNGYAFSSKYRDRLEKMTRFCTYMIRPDGSITPHGDSWPVNRDSVMALCKYSLVNISLPWRVKPDYYVFLLLGAAMELLKDDNSLGLMPLNAVFPKGGFYFVRTAWDSSALSLVIRNGASLSGHTHADHLSMDISAYGGPLLTEPGTISYAEGEERRYFKSSHAHSTIVIDNNSTKEYISTWKWRSSPVVGASEFTQDSDGTKITCWHYAYDPIRVSRTVALHKNRFWVVDDLISGLSGNEIASYYHFVSDKVELLNLDMFQCAMSNVSEKAPSLAIIILSPKYIPSIENGWNAPIYGIKVPCRVLKLTENKAYETSSCRTLLIPFPKGETPMISVKRNNNTTELSIGGSFPCQAIVRLT